MDNVLSLLQQVFGAVVLIVLVPGLLLFLWWLGVLAAFGSTPAGVTDPALYRLSVRAAFFIGMLIFILAVVAHLRGVDVLQGVSTAPMLEDLWRYVLASSVIGFALPVVVHRLLRTRAFAFFTLTVTALSATALYFYVFVDRTRDAVAVSTIGALIGAFFYVMLFPSRARYLTEIWWRDPDAEGNRIARHS